MANTEHLARLKNGVDAWNEWRKENPKVIPNLEQADLRVADLRGANLTKAKLGGANLRVANLEGAYLSEANLTGADLSEAVLGGANLGGADLMEANLTGARLTGAELQKANLTRVDLRGADLAWADLMMANLTGAKLREAVLVGARLVGAELTGADLSEATLTGVNLFGADLRDADLTLADITEANLETADLQGTYGLRCEDLWRARNWRDSIRDAKLECEPPADVDVGRGTDVKPGIVNGDSPYGEIVAGGRQYLIDHRRSVIEDAGAVKEIVSVLRGNITSLRLNSPEAAQADALMAKLPGCIDEFIAKLNVPDDEAAIDAAQRIYGQALLDTLQVWYDVPAGRVVLGAVALSLASLCGAGTIGAAVIGATVIGADSVLNLIKGLKAKLTD